MQTEQRTHVERHPASVAEVHARALDPRAVTQRFLELDRGRRHILEAGRGAPLLMLHGSGPSALHFLPLLERLRSVRAMALNRPGWGLSDSAVRAPGVSYRDWAVEDLATVIDALDLGEVNILGSSMGGTIAVWYALRHPERVRRLILVGAPPTLPGTAVPAPMLGGGSPPRPSSPPPPSTESVVHGMAMMGEGDTIVHHPELIEAEVAMAGDPAASQASAGEFGAIIGADGWQPTVLLGPDELERLRAPTLLIWGTRDPIGSVAGAAELAGGIRKGRLELVDGGHAPWLGNADRVAALVREHLG